MLDQTFVSQKAAIDPDNFALANCLRALAIDAAALPNL